MSTDPVDPVIRRHRDLEKIANVALRAGRIAMECGANCHAVREVAGSVARGLGAEDVALRLGYASLAITVTSGENTITRMSGVGRLGVDQRKDTAVRRLAERVGGETTTIEVVQADLDRLVRETGRHPEWLVDVATGTACAAFGRLLGIDWLAFLPVLIAGAIGQALRHRLLGRGMNLFVVVGIVAFVAATLCGLGARLAGSHSVGLAMMASILLLVPGVPATNAQTDIMDGYPTVGSARAVWVIMVMVFASAGFWLARSLLGGVSG
ncbi:MAG: threonine/serine exporter family protein [Phyllobacteriaceae bacterium]|nr:threonine/serine exporter family protein [Phyllobacteriaceae bacterium]